MYCRVGRRQIARPVDSSYFGKEKNWSAFRGTKFSQWQTIGACKQAPFNERGPRMANGHSDSPEDGFEGMFFKGLGGQD